MDKKYCFNCDKENKYYVNQEYVEYELHGVKFKVKQDLYYCSECHEEIDAGNSQEEMNNMIDGYFNYFGLSLQKLSDIRKSYNLTQELFAKILGWSKKSIVRYENGQSLPQSEYMNTYMELMNDPIMLYSLIDNKKDELKDDYDTILNKIKDNKLYKGINLLLYILHNRTLYRMQLMKNAFAIDILYHKNQKKRLTSFDYAHAPFGPVIDDFDKLFISLISHDYIEFKADENDKILLRGLKEPNMNIFDKEEISIMNEVIEKYKDKSSSELSNLSHKFIGWKNTKDGELINFDESEFFEL